MSSNNQYVSGVFTGNVVEQASTLKSFDPSTIYRSKQFNEAMEYFDKTDDLTRSILLSVNEADQNVVMTSLSNKLYQHIVDKVDDIDFGTIPLSKGDITQIDNYDKLVDCIDIITKILVSYHQPTEPTIGVVSMALQNMIDRTDMFTKAYKLNVEMPIIIYNTIALSIVSSVSFMISSCIEFIKLPDDEGFSLAVDKAALNKSKDNLLFTDLAKFNKMCGSGELDKAMDFIFANNAKGLTGSGAVLAFNASSVAVSLGLVLLIIPVIRELIFFFYYSRTRVADYFDAQASLLQMNAYNVENNLSREPKTRKEIAAKQRKVADFFKKIANTIKIQNKSGERDAQKEIKELNTKKYKHDEVLDSIPDSSNSVLF
jgi:hypothetical protein